MKILPKISVFALTAGMFIPHATIAAANGSSKNSESPAQLSSQAIDVALSEPHTHSAQSKFAPPSPLQEMKTQCVPANYRQYLLRRIIMHNDTKARALSKKFSGIPTCKEERVLSENNVVDKVICSHGSFQVPEFPKGKSQVQMIAEVCDISSSPDLSYKLRINGDFKGLASKKGLEKQLASKRRGTLNAAVDTVIIEPLDISDLDALR